MSYSFALPVGVLSEAEYADFRLTEELEPAEFMELFNRHLPRVSVCCRRRTCPREPRP